MKKGKKSSKKKGKSWVKGKMSMKSKKGKKSKKSKKSMKSKLKRVPSELERKITELMQKRLKKGPRPFEVIQAQVEKLMESFDKRGLPRPYERFPKTIEETPPVEKKCVNTKRDVMLKIREQKRKGEFTKSPINIEMNALKKVNYPRLDIIGLFDKDKKTVIKNNKNNVSGTLSGTSFISGGPFFGNYVFDNFHFHFGKSKNDGTEHTIDGNRFCLELHLDFVPYDDPCYPNAHEKFQTKKVTLAILFMVCFTLNNYELFSFIHHIIEEDSMIEIASNFLSDFKDVILTSDYYNYDGTCSASDSTEMVEWIIFRKVLPITKKQMNELWKFRDSIKDSESNIQPVSPLGERTIFFTTNLDHIKCRGKPSCNCYGDQIFSIPW